MQPLFVVTLNSRYFYFLFQADLQVNYSNGKDSDGRSILSDGYSEKYSSQWSSKINIQWFRFCQKYCHQQVNNNLQIAYVAIECFVVSEKVTSIQGTGL